METIGEVWEKYKPQINEPDWLKKIPFNDTRKAMKERINLLQDWIDYQITMYGGKSNVEQINKINQEISWLKTKLNELDGLEPEVETSPFIQVPYYISSPYNPYIDITGEDVINYVAEEISDFSDID